MNVFLKLVVVATILAAPPAQASNETRAFSDCVSAAATDEDRSLALAVAILVVAENPRFRNLVTVDPEAYGVIQAAVAETLERLLVFECQPQARDALRADGAAAISEAARRFLTESLTAGIQSPSESQVLTHLFDRVDADTLQSQLGLGN